MTEAEKPIKEITKGIYLKRIQVRCRCGKLCIYTPRNPNKLPKYPKAYCSDCDKQFSIRDIKMINPDHFKSLANFGKTVEKISKFGKTSGEEIILKLLDKGLYAQEISRKTSFSVSFLSKTIRSLKQRGLIIQNEGYPKTYKLAKNEKLFLATGIPEGTLLQKEKIARKSISNWVESLRLHLCKFKNKLIYKPRWLYQISRQGFIKGLRVKKIDLNNWIKFTISFDYQDFNGLECAEICNNVIIYNFNRKSLDQQIFSREHLEQYLQERIEDCKNVRAFLESKGFKIGEEKPIFSQKPHFALPSEGYDKALGSLGRDIILATNDTIIDDSPSTGGEEETTDIEKAGAMFDVPEKIDNLQKGISEMRKEFREMIKTIKELTETIKNAPKEHKSIPEGIYQ